MVELGHWADLAVKTWININPSTQWANRQIEPYRGLPFGHYLHSVRPRRPRALTLPLRSDHESWWPRLPLLSESETLQTTHEQDECGFLSRLPLDVRMIVYEYVLGGHVLHLTAQSPRHPMTHYICNGPNSVSEDRQRTWSGSDGERGSPSLDPEYERVSGFLPLLVTCRSIYSEAIDVLYSANIFEFTQNFAAFTFLCVMIPPQRLSRLRHFRLHLRIPRHPDLNSRASRDWRDLWEFLAHKMSGLQSLYLEFQMLQPMEAIIETTRDDQAASWLEPVIHMAVDAQRERRCRVEIETRGVQHEPAKIFRQCAGETTGASRQEIVISTCAALHERIRVSLGEPG